VISEPSDRWYEPREALLGQEYFMHAFGSFYLVSGHAVDEWIVPNAPMLRKLSNEGARLARISIPHAFVVLVRVCCHRIIHFAMRHATFVAFKPLFAC
jgi:hypothetical protein